MLPAAEPTVPAMSGNGRIVAFMTFGMVMPKANATAIRSAATRDGGVQPANVIASSAVEAAAISARPITSTWAGDIPLRPTRLSRRAPNISDPGACGRFVEKVANYGEGHR